MRYCKEQHADADLDPFSLQLLIVLSIPAAALGIPFALSHPILCIVLPLVVYYNPSLQEVVKPLLTALLQVILSGLRPAGSPKSAAFPWQQASSRHLKTPATNRNQLGALTLADSGLMLIQGSGLRATLQPYLATCLA